MLPYSPPQIQHLKDKHRPEHPGCEGTVLYVSGKVTYPHRPDLSHKRFWFCPTCRSFVGCHRRNDQGLTGFEPLGRLGDAETRKARSNFHAVFDQLWQKKHMSRGGAYTWLRHEMGITQDECHGAMFNIEQAKQALDLSRKKLATYS